MEFIKQTLVFIKSILTLLCIMNITIKYTVRALVIKNTDDNVCNVLTKGSVTGSGDSNFTTYRTKNTYHYGSTLVHVEQCTGRNSLVGYSKDLIIAYTNLILVLTHTNSTVQSCTFCINIVLGPLAGTQGWTFVALTSST